MFYLAANPSSLSASLLSCQSLASTAAFLHVGLWLRSAGRGARLSIVAMARGDWHQAERLAELQAEPPAIVEATNARLEKRTAKFQGK